ncbi:hypothetical protein [Ornithinimicrobium sufpigmenti]|uniref:hypothetical protein n=1 Tax=Ornithinimicrobium sufpigmenti TaxID=2508882 RepID=UPI001035C7BF|nr:MULTISPECIES: hypothetical protein [unclassified Ornithinimicrobium]
MDTRSTTPRTRTLATLSLATLVGVLAATGVASFAAGEDAPAPVTATDGGCGTPDAQPAARITGLWFGSTMYAAR